MRSILGDFPFSMENETRALFFSLPNPTDQVVHRHHLVLRKTNPPKLDIICERYRPLKLVHNFGSYIWATHGTSSQNKQCQTNNKLYKRGV